MGVACVVAGALPSVASAVPPTNDGYLQSTRVNQPGSTLASNTRFTGTVVDSTTQADILEGRPGGPIAENTSCVRPGFPAVGYNSTVWFDVFPHRPGNLTVTVEATAFGPLVGVMPFTPSTAVPDLSRFKCVPGTLGSATLEYHRFVAVREGAAYTIQVGATSGIQGSYSLNVYFDPDTDRDGLVDSNDACPANAGTAAKGGCPDSDNDGIIDKNDRCASQGGTAKHAGCPDTDGDNLADIDDTCDREDAREGRDRNKNGCPDREFLKPEQRLTAGSYCRGSFCLGIRVEKLVLSQIPRGTRVSMSCSRGACPKSKKTATRTKKVRFFSGQALRAGVKITLQATKKGYVGRKVTYTIQRNDWKKSKLKCLSGGRVKRCSDALLIR